MDNSKRCPCGPTMAKTVDTSAPRGVHYYPLPRARGLRDEITARFVRSEWGTGFVPREKGWPREAVMSRGKGAGLR